jgi:hypothetical protein
VATRPLTVIAFPDGLGRSIRYAFERSTRAPPGLLVGTSR